MSTITGLYKLSLDKEMESQLESGAKLHKRFSRIEFKIIKFVLDEKLIIVRTEQGKSVHENQMDEKDLVRITRDLFSPVFPDFTIHVDAVVFKPHPTDQVSPEWIIEQMRAKSINSKQIVAATGIDKTNISAWINGHRPMSQPVKALFYYFFKCRG